MHLKFDLKKYQNKHTKGCIVIIIEGIFQPKIKISWQCTHFQAIQDVDEFDSSSK